MMYLTTSETGRRRVSPKVDLLAQGLGHGGRDRLLGEVKVSGFLDVL